MKDIEFAEWLRKNGGDFTFKNIEKRPNAAFTEIYSETGKLIALVIYDNQKCDRWIYTI